MLLEVSNFYAYFGPDNPESILVFNEVVSALDELAIYLHMEKVCLSLVFII